MLIFDSVPGALLAYWSVAIAVSGPDGVAIVSRGSVVPVFSESDTCEVLFLTGCVCTRVGVWEGKFSLVKLFFGQESSAPSSWVLL